MSGTSRTGQHWGVKRREKEAVEEERTDPLKKYRNGGDGFILWAEEFLCVPVYAPDSDVPVWTPLKDVSDEKHPETGRSYKDFWECQKVELRKALVLGPDGKFKHRLIIFIWPRGEGKSAMACMIQLWKFFCFPKQLIVLGANSKDQTKFVHFDIMREMISNSPKLIRIIGQKNIQEKNIQLVAKDGTVISSIRPISTASGIVSNITGYTFSEIFDMKKPKFFTQLDGSIRNMPNAFGVIDSTVSSKAHKLYELYDAWRKGLDDTLFISYRYSHTANVQDYWHPHNTQKQLDSYKVKFTDAEYDAYFKNLWESGVSRAFSDEMIEAMSYYGIDGMVGGGPQVIDAMRKVKLLDKKMDGMGMSGFLDVKHVEAEKHEIMGRLWRVDKVVKLHDVASQPAIATAVDLEKLGQMYNTDWAIGVGVDRADPTAVGKHADTIITVVAKGLPNSKNNPLIDDSGLVPAYIYYILHVAKIDTSSLEDIKHELLNIRDTLDGIDGIAAEKWGMFDILSWCDVQQIPSKLADPEASFQIMGTDYNTQRTVFSEMYTVMASGRLKCPVIHIPGRKNPDILREQLGLFDHDAFKKWYGSPEKDLKNGVQDDSVYATAYAIYSVRNMNRTHFRPRSATSHFWGTFIPNQELTGHY